MQWLVEECGLHVDTPTADGTTVCDQTQQLFCCGLGGHSGTARVTRTRIRSAWSGGAIYIQPEIAPLKAGGSLYIMPPEREKVR